MVNAWVLVLILGSNGTHKNQSIDHIDGFSSKETCIAAGEQFVSILGKSDVNFEQDLMLGSFICMKRE